MRPDPETGMQADLHLPLQKKTWTVSEYEDPAQQRHFCVVSSGYNGLKVILRKDRHFTQAVKSTRSMPPGMTLRIAIGKHIYRSADEFFPATLTLALIEDLKTGKTAYLEWRDPTSGKFGIQRYTTMIALQEFAGLYEKCVARLEGSSPS